MKKDFENKLQEFKEYLKSIEYLSHACAVLGWDMRVGIPKKGVAYRSDALGYLAGEIYKLQTSDKMKEYIDYFTSIEELDDVTYAMVQNVKKQYDRVKKIPEDRFREYVVLTNNAQTVWEEAKEKSDFAMFKPYLEKIFDFTKEFANYYGYEGNIYNALLDDYEPGLTVENLDKVFSEVRDAIVELLNKIKNSKVKVDYSCFIHEVTDESQESIGKYVLDVMGFDFEAGRLDTSVHPFTTGFNKNDVRITTNYDKNDLRSSLFSCLHEGGHAIYEQDFADELRGTLLSNAASFALHESQSRFYENILGRSKEFCKFLYPEMKKRFKQFENTSFDEFYKGINAVEPSLIRTDADELTYSLHVIIRYELEKAALNGELKVEDLPKAWNEKYKEYLGIVPPNDSKGVLQDMHWGGGLIGYFPSYALGNLYGAQFLSKMEKDMPDLFKQVEEGNLGPIHEWLRENIHKYGAVYKPEKLIKMVTGEELKAKYFIDYLNKKYSEIYELE